MNRLEFLRRLGIGAGAAIIAPSVLAKAEEKTIKEKLYEAPLDTAKYIPDILNESYVTPTWATLEEANQYKHVFYLPRNNKNPISEL